MRSKVPLFALLLVAGSLALPLAAHAGGVPFFGPIIPLENNLCAAGWGMLVTVINNVISLLITLAIVFVAPLMIAYAGFLFVVNPVNSGGKEKAKGILTNTVVGIVIALAGWMIVDAIMAALYNANAPGLGGIAWSDLITGNPNSPCLIQTGQLQQLNQTNLSVSGVGAGGVNHLAPVSGDCSTNSLIANGINPSIATAMSCIAQQESSCNLTAQNPTSSAHGLFQVVMGYNDDGHNLNFSSCTAAAVRAGYQINGNLNCHNSVLAGGAPNPNRITLYNACLAASSNAICNAQAAQWLYTNNNGFRNWAQTAPRCGL